MTNLCQSVLNGKGMLDKWQTSGFVPTIKRKGNVKNRNAYRGVKLLEHAIKIVDRMLKRRIKKLVNVNAMPFGFMLGRETTIVLFVLRMQEKYVYVFCRY